MRLANYLRKNVLEIMEKTVIFLRVPPETQDIRVNPVLLVVPDQKVILDLTVLPVLPENPGFLVQLVYPVLGHPVQLVLRDIRVKKEIKEKRGCKEIVVLSV